MTPRIRDIVEVCSAREERSGSFYEERNGDGASFKKLAASPFLPPIFNHGLWAISLLNKIGFTPKDPQAPNGTGSGDYELLAWQLIDSTNPLMIAMGNRELVEREQIDILQPSFNTMIWVVTEPGSYFTEAPLPFMWAFSAYYNYDPLINIANQAYRMAWINNEMLPVWESATPATRTTWVNSLLGSLSHNP